MKLCHITLFCTALEWLAIGLGYLLPSLARLYTLMVAGSPMALAMALLQRGYPLGMSAGLYYSLIGFHLFKYFMFARIKIGGEGISRCTVISTLMEIAYVGLTSYVFYHHFKAA